MHACIIDPHMLEAAGDLDAADAVDVQLVQVRAIEQKLHRVAKVRARGLIYAHGPRSGCNMRKEGFEKEEANYSLRRALRRNEPATTTSPHTTGFTTSNHSPSPTYTRIFVK